MRVLQLATALWAKRRFSGSLVSFLMLLLVARLASLPRAGAVMPVHPPASSNGSLLFVDSGQTLGNQTSSDVALGDFDDDGDLDAFVTNAGGGTPDEVWINQGGDQGGTEGVFLDSGQILGTLSSMAVALGDLDGDTDLDAFIVADSFGDSNQVWTNQGNATGVFTQTTQVFGDSLSTGVALGKLDAGNTQDAFVGRAFGQASKVWLNDGSANFTDSGQSLDTDSGDVALGDVDGDDDLDAFSANASNNKVWINQGGSQAGAPGVFLDSGQVLTSGLSLAVDLGDLDGDGDLDAYVANSPADKVWVNQGGDQGGTEGVFLDSGQSLSAGQSRDVALEDLDGDGDLDAFLAKDTANQVWVNRGGDQGGTEGAFLDSSLRLGNSFSDGIALGDVDGDLDLDAFVANWPGPNKVWLNQGTDGPPVGMGWQHQAVDSRANSGKLNSLVLDTHGRPHISYVRFGQVTSGRPFTLWYAYWDGVRWHNEVVDQRHDISSTSLALDDMGQPHIGYGRADDNANSFAVYATRDGSDWQIETIDTDGQLAPPVSLALDTNQNPHMAYQTGGANNEFVYAQRIADVWLTETVAPLNSPFEIQISLALDSSDRPHIGYFDPQGFPQKKGAIKYAHDGGSGWQIELVENNAGPSVSKGNDPTLVLDGNGTPHLSYITSVENVDKKLKYAKLAGGSWLIQTVPAAENEFMAAAMQLGSDDEPHIVYSSSDIVHTYWDGADWQFETIVEEARRDEDLSLVLGADDRLHVTYYERSYGDLHYVSWAPKWQIHTPDDTALARSPAIDVMDAAPFINYYNEASGQVLLAEWNTGWTFNPAAFVGNPELQTSMVAGLSQQHVSYYDADNHQLMYGRWDGSNWEYRLVDEVGDVGRFNDIVLVGNSDAQVRIGYWDDTNHLVKLARIDGSSAPMTYTNTAGPPLDATSGYVSAAMLPQAHIGISYYDGVNGNLRLATWNPQTAGWTDRLVDGILADVGRLNSLQVDGTEGVPVFAYYDETNDAIKFAYELANGAFHLEEAVPGAGGVSSLSLALGFNSRQHARIAFTTTDGTLKLASLKEGIWELEAILSGGGPSSQVSLALDLRPHLAYAQTANGLKYAFRTATLEPSGPDRPYLSSSDGYYNPLDACEAVLEFFLSDRTTSLGHRSATSVPRTHSDGAPLGDLAIFDALSNLFAATPGGQHYIDLYGQHGSEMGQLGLDDPQLLWDAYGTLQNFLPGLEALVMGTGDEFLITQQMVDDALDIWQRLAAASPELASTIDAELMKSNNLQDFVGMSFDEWALDIGVVPPTNDLYLPIVAR